jgi:DNA polymerase-3 subunit alpha
MMFATLDDLEGAVEILVFGKALAEYEGALGVDEIVLVRGRVDHKEGGKTSVVVQTVEPFRPDADEIERARAAARERETPKVVHIKVDVAQLPAEALDELRHVLGNFPGESDVVLELGANGSTRRVRLGPEYRVSPTPSLRAELEHVLGPTQLAAAAAVEVEAVSAA